MRQTSQLVPPMSSATPSRRAAGAREPRPADRAAGDAGEQQRRPAGRAASAASACPPFDFSSDHDARDALRRRAPRRARRRRRSHQRLEVGVDGRRRAALVLAPDRRHLVRERHRHARPQLGQQLARPQLVLRVEVGEQVTHGDRGAPASPAPPEQHGAQRLAVERLDSRPPRPAARRADAVAPPHHRRGLAPAEVVVVLAVDALDERDVLEAARRQVDDARARAGSAPR